MKWSGDPWTKIWTAPNFNAVIIMGIITILLTVAQSRTWVIIRYLFLRVTQPNRLADGLENLSQLAALKITKKFLCKHLLPSRCHSQRPRAQPWEYRLPLFIGIWATLNALGFIVAGISLPWFLTDGAFGAPEVRSQQTNQCTSIWAGGTPAEFTNSNILLASSMWEQCQDEKNVDSYCDPSFASMRTYDTSFESGCIFPSQVCLEGHPTVTFTVANMTARDLGTNSKLKMTVSHRIRCSPISLSPFITMTKRPGDASPYTMSIRDPGSKNASEYQLKLDLNMWTDNGPDSGRKMYERRSAFSAKILPRLGSNITSNASNHIHHLLRVSDAQTFVLVLKAGGSWYSSPITDPLFEAAEIAPYSGIYVPTREATGIGCAEQTQTCIELPSGHKCYPWTSALKDPEEIPRTMLKELIQFNDVDTVMEYMTVFWKYLEGNFGEQGLQFFLRRYLFFSDSLLVKRFIIDPYPSFYIKDIDPRHQWISELNALFHKARYWQKLSILGIVRNNIDRKNDTLYDRGYDYSLYSLCNKILFIDADSTNINWVGMWATIGALLVLCMISYGISLLEWIKTSEWVHKKWERIGQMRMKVSRGAYGHFQKLQRTWYKLCTWVQKKLERIRGIQNQDPEVNLRTFADPIPRPLNDEPDNSI